MLGLTLKHLRYFEALARHRHFGRAAEACGVTQPALSQQMKELEGMAGLPLLERSTRRLELTAAGTLFLERAGRILRAVDDLETAMRAADGQFPGGLRLGAIPTVGPYLLPGLIGALAARFPDLEVEVREAVTRTLVADLLEGRLDLAIVALPISEPALWEEPLFEEAFVLVRPAADRDRPVPIGDRLGAMRLLLLEEGHCFRDQALAFCGRSGGTGQRPMEGSSLATLVRMVGAGLGVTLIPEMAVPAESRGSGISVARFPDPAPTRTLGLVWRKTNPLAPHFRALGPLVKDVNAAECGVGPVLD